ncbi:MAG: metallophosphatase family protein [Clostridia bacterium]|nr:metallophosphatase family protein [Clostridia bacterium]
MRILLFSDSHGNINNMVKAIRKSKDIDMIIHLGDFVSDALKLKELYSYISFEYVHGNNDWSREIPGDKILELEEKKVLITHGHNYNVKNDYQKIIRKGKAAGTDAVFFGHTHINEEIFYEGMLVLNPGSIGAPGYFQKPTYAVVEISKGKICSRFQSI